MKQIHFFALKEDTLPVLNLVEEKGRLSYHLTGNYIAKTFNSECRVYSCGKDIRDLGTANGYSSTLCDTYLVCDSGTTVSQRHIQGNNGIERICIDQLENQDTVTFTPAGRWQDAILNGLIATASDSIRSQAIMKLFYNAIRKSFTKVNAFWVGPAALTCFHGGQRLTSSEHSPRVYDLAYPIPKSESE